MGRPRLSAAEKARRGTLEAHRERGPEASTPVQPAGVPARNYVGIAAAYAAAVSSGAVVACKWVKLACARQEKDRRRAAEDPTWPYVWDDAQASAACHFVEHCPHVEGRWTTALIVLQPWQVFLVATLFGWRQRSDGSRRRFTILYLEVARKAAKSTLAAALALYHLLREDEPGASVVCGATTGQQARVVFGIMQKMTRRSAWLRGQGLQVFANAIISSDGEAKPVNAKASTQDGLNPSLIVLDEAHAQDFELHDVLKSAQGARPNPLMLCPTTAGYNLLSVGYALRTQLTKILQDVFEADHLFGAIYALDEEDDWRDATVWLKSMPMLGISPKLDYVRTYCLDAQQATGLEGEFKVKMCNLWSQSASSWLSMVAWDRCADESLKLEDFAGQHGWIGGDLAQLDDIAAVALLFERGEELCAFVRFYLPRLVVQQRARAVPAYQSWVNAGLLVLTEGNMIDYAAIEADIRRWCQTFNILAIRFDQYGSAGIVSNLAGDGFPAAILDKSAKNFTPPARDLETRVRHQRFRHDGNSCLKWMASNVVVRRGVDDSLLPKKESAESPNKIDGIDAILQANSGRLGTLTTHDVTADEAVMVA